MKNWPGRRSIEQHFERSVLIHEIAHCIAARALLGPNSVDCVVVRSDGSGFMNLRPSVKVSKGGKRIIASASDVFDQASDGDLMHHRGDVAAWREAKRRARVLLDAHLPEFWQLVSDLEKLGEVSGRHVDLVFELQEKANRIPQSLNRAHEQGLRYRDVIWATR
jgi:hypothetical protein